MSFREDRVSQAFAGCLGSNQSCKTRERTRAKKISSWRDV